MLDDSGPGPKACTDCFDVNCQILIRLIKGRRGNRVLSPCTVCFVVKHFNPPTDRLNTSLPGLENEHENLAGEPSRTYVF